MKLWSTWPLEGSLKRVINQMRFNLYKTPSETQREIFGFTAAMRLELDLYHSWYFQAD